MDTSQLVDVLRQSFVATGVLLAPALFAALAVGIVMSMLQTITQIQDQAISFVPKMAIVGLVIFAMLPWMTDYYVEYAREIFTHIPNLVSGG